MIDPGSLRKGIIMLPWQLLAKEQSSSGEAGRATLVDSDALHGALPKGMARRTREDRKAQIARRGADFDRRFDDRCP